MASILLLFSITKSFFLFKFFKGDASLKSVEDVLAVSKTQIPHGESSNPPLVDELRMQRDAALTPV